MPLAQLLPSFQPLLLLPTSKMSPAGADSQLGEFVYLLGPCGISSKLSYVAGNFFHHRNSCKFLQLEVLRLSFPALEPWVMWSVSLPSCSSQFIHTLMRDHPILQLLPCHASSLPQLPIYAPPTSLDECFFFNSLVVRYYTVQFSGISCFLFLNLLLSFFWLCEEA